MPSRSLNAAIDFLALVMTGRWPAISASSSAAEVTFLVSCTPSPTPMFSTILSSRGTSIALAYLNSANRLALSAVL